MKRKSYILIAFVLMYLQCSCTERINEENMQRNINKFNEQSQSVNISQIQRDAINGDSKAQSLLGYHYLIGKEVPQDCKKAFEWTEKAAKQGNVDAQFNIGAFYLKGICVNQDFNEGYKWTLKAANQENAQAQYNLGTCYLEGKGIKQDYTKGILWFKKSCENGFQEACNKLKNDKLANNSKYSSQGTRVHNTAERISKIVRNTSLKINK